MIEDKTKSVADYKEYINGTYLRYTAIGMDISDVNSNSLNGLFTNRFSLTLKMKKMQMLQ